MSKARPDRRSAAARKAAMTSAKASADALDRSFSATSNKAATAFRSSKISPSISASKSSARSTSPWISHRSASESTCAINCCPRSPNRDRSSPSSLEVRPSRGVNILLFKNGGEAFLALSDVMSDRTTSRGSISGDLLRSPRSAATACRASGKRSIGERERVFNHISAIVRSCTGSLALVTGRSRRSK